MRRNYSDLLGRALAGWRLDLLRLMAYQASMLHMPLYLVGGVVRDIFLGRAVNDFDLVMEGDSAVFAEYIVRKYGGKISVHAKFRTATWVINESTFNRLNIFTRAPDTLPSFDLITARTETYAQPGALPTVERSTIDDDLRRRDFTINAMAIRLDGDRFGELFDPVNGKKDLENGFIRVLHPRSFVDDPTRMLRAVRYAARYGFRIERGTRSLIDDEARGVLAQLSGERLRHEIDLMFDEERADAMLKSLKELDLLSAVYPALQTGDNGWLSVLTDKPEEGFSGFSLPDILSFRQVLGWILCLVELSSADIEVIAQRLAFPALLTEAVMGASSLNRDLPASNDWKPSQWTFYLDQFPALSVYAVYLMKLLPGFQDYFMIWRNMKPYATGHTLQQRGLEPGPRYAEILRQLRVAWLDGEVQSEEEEMKLLTDLIRTEDKNEF